MSGPRCFLTACRPLRQTCARRLTRSLATQPAAPSYEPVLPSPTYNFTGLVMEQYPTHGWVRYVNRDGDWGPAEWMTDMNFAIPIHSVVLNYGQACFEGLKALRFRDNTVRLFRPEENSKRLNRSCDVLSMPPVPEDLFLEACTTVVSRNLDIVPPYAPNAGAGSLYLRPIMFGSEGCLNLRGAREFTFAVYCSPLGNLYGASGAPVKPLDALVTDVFDRAAPLGTGAAKLAGNYAPVFKHALAAKAAGFGITLHLDSRTRSMIDEFSSSNFLALKYGPSGDRSDVTLIVPESTSILKSVTTMCVIEVAAETFGWRVEVRPLPFVDVVAGELDEVAAAGTAAALSPIRSISYRGADGDLMRVPIGDGTSAGPRFTEMLSELAAIQCGDKAAPSEWHYPRGGVPPAPPGSYTSPLVS